MPKELRQLTLVNIKGHVEGFTSLADLPQKGDYITHSNRNYEVLYRRFYSRQPYNPEIVVKEIK